MIFSLLSSSSFAFFFVREGVKRKKTGAVRFRLHSGSGYIFFFLRRLSTTSFGTVQHAHSTHSLHFAQRERQIFVFVNLDFRHNLPALAMLLIPYGVRARKKIEAFRSVRRHVFVCDFFHFSHDKSQAMHALPALSTLTSFIYECLSGFAVYFTRATQPHRIYAKLAWMQLRYRCEM